MPAFLVPLHESNDCHTPAGSPQGGQFCSKTLSRSEVDDALNAASGGWTSDDWPGFEGLDAFEAMEKLGFKHKSAATALDGKDTVRTYRIGKDLYVLRDDDDSLTEASDWITNVDATDWIDTGDFHEEFWSGGGTVYHATSEENARSIDVEGLGPQKKTRGLTNRWVGNAVYTHSDPEAILSYGDVVYEIDVAAMKRDGHMPRVEMEPDAVAAIAHSALAHKLGIESEYSAYDDPAGADEGTVVFFGGIPPKYLTRLN